jgi:2'-5' RNA ligase
VAECVVVLLGGEEARAVESLWADLEGRGGGRRGHRTGPPHVTLAIVRGEGHTDALRAVLLDVAADHPSFRVPGAGYGLFVGHGPDHPVLHLPLTRTPQLAALHEAIVAGSLAAGLDVDGQTMPEHWRPHVTLADDGLDADRVGETMRYLVARSPHRWSFAVETLAVLGAEPGPAARVDLRAEHG